MTNKIREIEQQRIGILQQTLTEIKESIEEDVRNNKGGWEKSTTSPSLSTSLFTRSLKNGEEEIIEISLEDDTGEDDRYKDIYEGELLIYIKKNAKHEDIGTPYQNPKYPS